VEPSAMGAAASEPRDDRFGHPVVLKVYNLSAQCCHMQDVYHTSVVVDDVEYAFTDMGIMKERVSTKEGTTGVYGIGIPAFRGMSAISGQDMERLLSTHFQRGSYDLLKKNCNTFSDCALFCLLGERLAEKYRSVEKVAGFLNDLTGVVQAMSQGRYKPNPKAQDFETLAVLKQIEVQMRREGGIYLPTLALHHSARTIQTALHKSPR